MFELIVRNLKNVRDHGIGILLGLVSRRRRFSAATRLANTIGPLREMIARLRGRQLRLGSGREYTLAYLLGCMDICQLEFATKISVSGLEDLRRAAGGGRGVLVVTTHANAGLARLILRPLADLNIAAVTISGGFGFPICGSGAVGETIAPGGTFFVRVRSKLRAGFVVCAMLDAPTVTDRTRRHVTADGGSTWLADPLIRLAVRWQVPIAVLTASFRDDRVLLEVQISTSCNENDVMQALSPLVSSMSVQRKTQHGTARTRASAG